MDRAAPWRIPVGYDDDAGVGIEGLGAVVRELCSEGVFVPDAARLRRLIGAAGARAVARRHYLQLDPAVGACLYRAARFWATEALTVSKNLETDLWSSPPTKWVSPPKPRHAPAVR